MASATRGRLRQGSDGWIVAEGNSRRRAAHRVAGRGSDRRVHFDRDAVDREPGVERCDGGRDACGVDIPTGANGRAGGGRDRYELIEHLRVAGLGIGDRLLAGVADVDVGAERNNPDEDDHAQEFDKGKAGGVRRAKSRGLSPAQGGDVGFHVSEGWSGYNFTAEKRPGRLLGSILARKNERKPS